MRSIAEFRTDRRLLAPAPTTISLKRRQCSSNAFPSQKNPETPSTKISQARKQNTK